MNIYGKVAVASCGLLMATLMSDTSIAQTRVITASQLRAAQLRAAQQRASQTRSTTVRRPIQVVRPATSTPSSTKRTSTAPATPKDKIPEAALLTERGTQLVERLKRLRYTESTMGSRHPSLSDIRDQIASVKEELQAWVPAVKTVDADAKDGDQVQTAERALAQLNEEDLRQLVVRLSLDIYKLRNRVAELESKQKKISSLVVERE